MSSPLYDKLNQAWKSTTRIVLGEELGELKDYEQWLNTFFPATRPRRSSISGKEVTLTVDDYCDGGKFISIDEVKEKAIEPLSINEVKDIDSILSAISEKWEYTGNKTFGNSAFVDTCDLITDSQYVSNCLNIQNVQYAYSLYEAQYGSYIFGSGQLSESEFLIGFFSGVNNKRCFYSSDCNNSSDLYLSHNCQGCQDMMFSFHQNNKRNRIGNLELPKEKYIELKKKLLGEIRGEIKNTKRFDHLPHVITNKDPKHEVNVPNQAQPEGDMDPIEKAFATTYKILFRKEPTAIADYEKWLKRRIVPTKSFKTRYGAVVYLPKHEAFKFFAIFPAKRLVTYQEAMELGKLQVEGNSAGDLGELKQWLSDTQCFCADFSSGKNTNIIDSAIVMDSTNIYDSYVSIKSENVGVNSWPLRSKYLFGCNHVVNSQFTIKSYNSAHLNRCFEMDACTKCSDSMFSHNCEGLAESMFCFNVKGKRYAIGNAQMLPDRYRSIKDMLIEQIADELDKKKDLHFDIYNIGCCNG